MGKWGAEPAATLLHLYCPGSRPADQTATWEALATCEWPRGLSIVHCPGPEPLDNARWVEMHWDLDGDLITLEQDILVTPWHINDLRHCGSDFCAFDFTLAHGVPWTEVPGGTGIGLAKMSRAARAAVVPVPACPQVPWHDLADELFSRMPPVHVHRPLIGHNHRAA